jgi:hypothetical protein
MKFSELKKNGYYILKSVDTRKKLTEFSIVKDLPEGEKEILTELNRAAYKMAKNSLKLEVRTKKVCFLNYIPFAERNKEKTPMHEFYTTNQN